MVSTQFEKYARQNGNLPQIGVKKKKRFETTGLVRIHNMTKLSVHLVFFEKQRRLTLCPLDRYIPMILTDLTEIQGIVGCTPTNVPLWEIPI